MKTAARAAIKDFLSYCKGRGMSQSTIVGYEKDCTDFFKYNKLSPKQVKRVHCIAYLGMLTERKLMGNTIRRSIAAVSSMYNYMANEIETVVKNPFLKLKMPPKQGKPKVLMTEEECTAMLDLPCETRAQRMDKLCIEIMYSTAARRADLWTAKLADLNLPEATLFVIGKGKKPATLKLTPRCVAAIEAYLRDDRPKVEHPNLLLTAEGEAMTGAMIYHSVERVAHRAGITKKVHPHAWRRSILTHLYDRGMPIKSVQDTARHSNMATTDGYIMAGSAKVKKDLQTYHPNQSSTCV